jgi:glycylpeptide N-tetradecanoyltransferase
MAHHKERACVEEIIDATEADAASESSDEEPQSQAAQGSQEASASTSASKKRKKKKSKAARALAALRPQGAIPQSLVDQVVEKVKAEHGEGAPGTDEAHVRMALEQLKVGDVIKGKAGIGGKNRKEMGEHKVCHLTQS